MHRRADRFAVGVWALLALVTPAIARGQSSPDRARSPQEERRRKLLKEMGLEEKRSPSPAPASPSKPDVGAPGAASDSGADQPATGAAVEKIGVAGDHRTPSATASPSPPASFRRVIHPLFVQTCKSCHTVGGTAAATSLVLSGEAGVDHLAMMRVLDVRAPGASLLLSKASGQKPHAGGAPWPVEGAAYKRVLGWIQAGARLDGAGAIEVPSAPPAPSAPLVPRPPSPVVGSVVGSSQSKAIVADQAVAPPERPVMAIAAVEADRIDFATRVHPLLMARCGTCHGPLGQAASTRLALVGEVRRDYVNVRALVDPASPSQSALIVKAAGQAHAGGAVLPADSAGHVLLLTWVAEGATAGAVDTLGVNSAPLDSSPAPPPGSVRAVSGAPEESLPPRPVPGGQSATPPPALALPFGLSINGRFDLAYERRNFSGDPFGNAATNALRSYHHFLFLSRESVDDPVGLSVELLSLQFWEAHYRWRASRLPVQVVIAGGKILVPFGADPLMHQSYGGLSGFDQRILPVIWSQEGVAVHVTAHRGDLTLTDDLYLVRGYALGQAGGIINLQNGFSPDDHVRLGWGNRLGGGWGPLSAWYSTYYNSLGFGRRLFMQAADVMLWRMRQVPILGHFSFAAGLLRSDVSGGNAQGAGGPGKDYYDFGSYFQARYHPTDWLYVQYRQGLRTFNNRRGIVVDDTRLTSEDGSTHNFGVVARTGGLTAGLYYFINLEKAGEIPDDLLRVSLTYDF